MKKRKIIKLLLSIFLIVSWLLTGWPAIWKNPRIPPRIREAQAATTGEKYPTLGETAKETPWSNNDWTTPTNIYADDEATANVTAATFDTDDQTYVLKATGFDFSAIPDGSTIDGVIVRANSWYRSGQGSGSMDLCQLLDASKAKVGTNNCSTAVALTTTNTTVITKGSSTDLWGNVLTSAWVKNANFGMAIGILATAANADVDIDYVTIEIYYTPPAAVVSVSVSDGIVTYSMMPANTSKTTLSGELNDMQTVTNDGNVTENFNIKGQDATGGGCTWTLASTNGSDQYVYQFCNDTDLDCSLPPTNYTALTTSYQTLKTGVAVSGTVNFQLRLTTPNPSSCYGQQSVDVTVQAAQ